jgi:hypothetical protein
MRQQTHHPSQEGFLDREAGEIEFSADAAHQLFNLPFIIPEASLPPFWMSNSR